MKEMLKKIVFALVILTLILVIGFVAKTGKFAKLEGYMYSFATEIVEFATDSNIYDCATSSNATSSNVETCATSSNATSSNVETCATSSNATNSNVETCATSSNVTNSNVETCATSSNATSSNAETCATSSDVDEEVITTEEYITTKGQTEHKSQVSFLESHKMYIMIIGLSIVAIIIVSIIIIVDKKAIEKRKAKSKHE